MLQMLTVRIPIYHFRFSSNKNKVFLGNVFMREPGYMTSSMTIIMIVVVGTRTDSSDLSGTNLLFDNWNEQK